MESEKPSWYGLHKEQVKLIQFLLYHLKKHQARPVGMNDGLKIERGQFILKFD